MVQPGGAERGHLFARFFIRRGASDGGDAGRQVRTLLSTAPCAARRRAGSACLESSGPAGPARRLRSGQAPVAHPLPLPLPLRRRSVTWGAIQGNGYVSQFFHWLNTTFPPLPGRPPHALLNRGVGGATSSLFSTCTNHFVPADADLVVVEFAHNDGAQVFCGGKMSGACGGGLVHSVAPGCAQRASWMQTRARGWLWRNSAAPAAWSGVLLQSAVRCTNSTQRTLLNMSAARPQTPLTRRPAANTKCCCAACCASPPAQPWCCSTTTTGGPGRQQGLLVRRMQACGALQTACSSAAAPLGRRCGWAPPPHPTAHPPQPSLLQPPQN